MNMFLYTWTLYHVWIFGCLGVLVGNSFSTQLTMVFYRIVKCVLVVKSKCRCQQCLVLMVKWVSAPLWLPCCRGIVSAVLCALCTSSRDIVSVWTLHIYMHYIYTPHCWSTCKQTVWKEKVWITKAIYNSADKRLGGITGLLVAFLLF